MKYAIITGSTRTTDFHSVADLAELKVIEVPDNATADELELYLADLWRAEKFDHDLELIEWEKTGYRVVATGEDIDELDNERLEDEALDAGEVEPVATYVDDDAEYVEAGDFDDEKSWHHA